MSAGICNGEAICKIGLNGDGSEGTWCWTDWLGWTEKLNCCLSNKLEVLDTSEKAIAFAKDCAFSRANAFLAASSLGLGFAAGKRVDI